MNAFRTNTIFKIKAIFVVIAFATSLIIPPQSHAQGQSVFNLPVPGSIVPLSKPYSPVIIMGVNIHPDDPLKLDFIISKGASDLEGETFKKESEKLVRYFLASLTIPENEMWVNLSPYEKDRIIPDSFGQTEMGHDLLAMDYILKQLSATLMHPDEKLGKEFWARVHSKAQERFGTSEIPVNTFNKIWIVPDEVTIHEHQRGALIVDAQLKVMLEEDYLALEANKNSVEHGLGNVTEEKLEHLNNLTEQIYKEVIIPEIEKEVNEGETFAPLRQIYHSMLLASWYKESLKKSLLGKVYVNQHKIKGVDIEDKNANEKIYQHYIEAFKKGTHNLIKEDYDPMTQQIIPRKYFSGGIEFQAVQDFAQLSDQSFIAPFKALAIAGGAVVVSVALTLAGVEYYPPVRNAVITTVSTEQDYHSVRYLEDDLFSNLSQSERSFKTTVDEIIDEAIEKGWRPVQVKEAILELWKEDQAFSNQFNAINTSTPREGIEQNDTLVRIFYFGFGRYTLHAILNQLGITDSSLREKFEAQFKKDFGVGYALNDVIGGKTVESFAPAKIIMPIKANNIHSEIFSTISHEVIHWLEEIAKESLIGLSDLRQALINISFGEDLDKKWLLASSLGEFNHLVMENRLYGNAYEGGSVTLSLSKDQIDADIRIERGETPFQTHVAIRSSSGGFGLGFEVNFMQRFGRSTRPMDTWQDVVSFINEEYSSGKEFYKEGIRFAFYAMSQYGLAGDFLLRLYGTYYNQMNFAQMELATMLLNDILSSYNIRAPRSMIEDRIREEAIGVNLDSQSTYQEISLIAENLRDKIANDFVDQGMIGNRKTTVTPSLSSVAQFEEVGGIDLNPAMMDIKKEGQGLTLPKFENFYEGMTIESIAPIIINISPFTNTYLLSDATSVQ